MHQTLTRHPADLAASLAVIFLIWVAAERLAPIRAPATKGLGIIAAGSVAAFLLYAIWGA